MQIKQWLKRWKSNMIIGGSILLIILSGVVVGLVGCGGSGGDSPSSPETGPNSKACQQVDPQCWACEDQAVKSEPACAGAAACAGGENFWQCIETTLGEENACTLAIDRACYQLGSVCSQAWEACAENACQSASFKAYQCDQQVLFQNAACAGVSECFWSYDPWTCIENALGEDSACEHALDATCYKKGTVGEEYWKTCAPKHYACSQQAIATCTAWLQEQPTCDATDRQLIRACQATSDLYSDACYQQDSATSDACWETLQSREDCQMDACEYLWN